MRSGPTASSCLIHGIRSCVGFSGRRSVLSPFESKTAHELAEEIAQDATSEAELPGLQGRSLGECQSRDGGCVLSEILSVVAPASRNLRAQEAQQPLVRFVLDGHRGAPGVL